MAFRENAAILLTDRKLIVFIALVAGFSVLGPFGTYGILDLWQRLIFWSLTIAGIGMVMHLAIALALTGETFGALPRPLRIAAGASIAAVPSAAFVIFMSGYYFPNPISSGSFPMLWCQVALIGTVAGIIEYRRPPKPPAKPADPVRVRLHARLSADVRSDIVSLSMHDHYVEVTTTTGKQMVLMRMSDAIAELDHLPGVRTHRSHWAARAHMRDLSKKGRKHHLTLSDGRTLPVSASHLEAVTAELGPNKSGNPDPLREQIPVN